MKSPIPLVCLLAATNASFAQDALVAYREGNYIQAAQQLKDAGNDPVANFYLGRMRLYGYGLLKNNTQALEYFKQAAERGFLPAQTMLARVALFEEHNLEQALYWFKKAADANDENAQMYCAAAYLFGLGTKQNQDTAKRFYIAAAKNGNSIAQYTLAESFLETRHAANKTLGLIWLNKSVAQNNPEAQLMLSELYTNGTLVTQDFNKAIELAKLAQAQGYVPAIYQMGEIARAQNDMTSAKQWYLKASESSYRPADIALANLYLDEKNSLHDAHAGFLWMLKAAQNGSSEAQLALAAMYKQGIGVEVDDNLAKEWQQKAQLSAKSSPASSEMKAALWLSNRKATQLSDTQYALTGILTPWKNDLTLKANRYNASPEMEDMTRAQVYQPQFVMVQPNTLAISDYYHAWVSTLGSLPHEPWTFPALSSSFKVNELSSDELKQLMNQAVLGDFDAQFELAQRYEEGIGVEKNSAESIKWYQLAASQQDLRAQYRLAVLYLEEKGSASDVSKGLSLLQDAAFKGDVHSQYALARLYEQGFNHASGQEVIKPNANKAQSMYQLAAFNNHGLAQYRLAEQLARDKSSQTQLIHSLYQKAAKNGVTQAFLPLAFFNAMSKDPTIQQKAFDVAKTQADKGDVSAALLLGLMYDRGLAVTSSHDKALEWYQKAQSNPVANFILGTYTSLTDAQKGQALLQQSADAGFSYANLNLSILSQQRGQPFLPALEKALAQGNSTAGLLLADYYLTQANNTHQMKQAYDIYLQFAQKGDKQAQLKLAFMLEHGLGVVANMTGAQQWYTASAEQGEPMAQYCLGRLYQLGVIDKQPNYPLAKQWYKKAQDRYAPAAIALGFLYDTVDDKYQQAQQAYQLAATMNDAVGQFDTGLLYEYGKGQAVDVSKASQLYLSAAQRGHAQAMVQLAGLYLKDSSHDKQAQAVAWYKKAAELGNRDALYQLGVLSETGVGMSVDYSKALQYYQEARQKGHAKAVLALAKIYETGLGVPKDPEQSKQLLLEAQKNGSIQAQKALQRLATQ